MSDRDKSGKADGGEVKTAQPFADHNETPWQNVTGGEPKPRSDAVDDPVKRDEANKVTQRQE